MKRDDKNIIIIVLLALLFLFSFSGGSGYMGGMMLFGPFFMLSVLVLTVWLIVSLTHGGKR